jgi:amino acid transporter
MIGWGWVLLSGDWIRQAGSLGSIVAFLLGGIMVSFVGLVYAELTAALPRAGGALGFTYRGLGIRGAWACAWLLILAYIGVCAFEAVALSQVCHSLFPFLKAGYLYSVAGSPVHVSGIVVSVVCSLLLLTVNLVGLSGSARLQTISTFGLLAIGLLFFAGSGLHGSAANLPPVFTGAAGVLAVAIMTPFFYTGFDVIPQAAEEIKLPQKEIGKLILIAVAMAAAWYAGIQLCVGLGLPESSRETRSERLITEASVAPKRLSRRMPSCAPKLVPIWSGFSKPTRNKVKRHGVVALRWLASHSTRVMNSSIGTYFAVMTVTYEHQVRWANCIGGALQYLRAEP